MEENKKKKRTAGDVIRTLIMIVALGVFCYSGYQLLSIYQEYKKGSDEYHALENKYIDEKGMFEDQHGCGGADDEKSDRFCRTESRE